MIPLETACSIIATDISPDDYDKLRYNFRVSVEENGWSEGNQKSTAIKNIVSSAGVTLTDAMSVYDFTLSVVNECEDLAQYFRLFAEQLNAELISTFAAGPVKHILFVNLLPLYLSTSLIDKVVGGLYSDDSFLLKFQSIVILVRNSDWLIQSGTFARIRAERPSCPQTSVVDIRCYGARSAGLEWIEFQLPSRSPFRDLLDTSTESIYLSLIYHTNSYIGHFALPNAHVRTHYDLRAYVTRDDVTEFLYYKLAELMRGAERVLVLGVGMEIDVIGRMGYYLSAMFGEQVSQFCLVSDSSPGQLIPSDWTEMFDLAVILTDIVNTGKTVERWMIELHKRSPGKPPVKIFTVAAMQNSPSEIFGIPLTSGVTIKRHYYPPNPEECTLCIISQPVIPVNKAEDFCQVANGQLTPFDFWEMVAEARAIKRMKPDPQGRPLTYRIDTEVLVRHYGRWLRNVIAFYAERAWPNVTPDVLCTVAEPASKVFSGLVRRALNVKRMIAIDRRDLHRVTPGGGLPEGASNPFEGEKKVLIVDDGINWGNTMKGLIAYCRACGVLPVGAIVLDSRLDKAKTRHIQELMGGNRLVALYEWPARTAAL